MASLLIIDDDVTLLTRLAAQLEAAGFQVARSSDVVHGERLFAEQRPDLVILDVRAGDGRGWEALERLASERPVMVLSGLAREEDVVRAFEAGAVDFIAKPYRSAELVARVRARLGETLAPGVATTTAAAVGAPSLAAPAPAAGSSGMSEPSPSPAPAARPHVAPEPRSKNRRRAERNHHDEAVFMSEAEEMALLRAPPPARSQTPPTSAILSEEEAARFGPRLRAERLRRHLTLVQLENELHIRMSYLQAIEDEKFTLLPRGPAALDMIRRYAEHLGVDPAAVLEELGSKFSPEAPEPPVSLGGAPASRSLPRWLIPLIAVALALALGFGAIAVFDPGFYSRALTSLQELWSYLLGLMGQS
ncbi:MAG: response regulator [Oscillochloridaceae bacterium]|nr:response regulator [Chloroflexaceae bacterium]MDW8388590.1 response regulator [Oscillochloridaceae bacterium]